jgi:hypothetical protein
VEEQSGCGVSAPRQSTLLCDTKALVLDLRQFVAQGISLPRRFGRQPLEPVLFLRRFVA